MFAPVLTLALLLGTGLVLGLGFAVCTEPAARGTTAARGLV
jgi:hypothetical protein